MPAPILAEINRSKKIINSAFRKDTFTILWLAAVNNTFKLVIMP